MDALTAFKTIVDTACSAALSGGEKVPESKVEEAIKVLNGLTKEEGDELNRTVDEQILTPVFKRYGL